MDLRSPRTRLMIVAALAGAVDRGGARASGLPATFPLQRILLARAEHQQQHIVEISPSRAEIFDRNMHALAMSAVGGLLLRRAVGNRRSGDGGAAARRGAGRFRRTRSRRAWRPRIRSCGSRASCLRKQPRASQALNLRGIYFQQEGQRFYPKRELAAPCWATWISTKREWAESSTRSTTASAASPGAC